MIQQSENDTLLNTISNEKIRAIAKKTGVGKQSLENLEEEKKFKKALMKENELKLV
jgi:hypothetical protein